MSNRLFLALVSSVFLLGVFLRLYRINFGLPLSFYADEPEFGEFAVKYAFESVAAVRSGLLYQLKPVSFVYGTVPTYTYTLLVFVINLVAKVAGFAYTKTTLFIAMRAFTAVFSLAVIPLVLWLYTKVFERSSFSSKFDLSLLLLLVIGNFKLIQHAHYMNADIFLVVLLLASIVFFCQYLASTRFTNVFLVFSALFFGLAVGTKFTALLSLPIYLILFLRTKRVYDLAVFCLICFGAFLLSNPFSFVFLRDFVSRIYEASFKENGLVFDSADYSYLKYMWALTAMLGPAPFLLSICGMFFALKNSEDKSFGLHLFLVGNVLVYFVFFTIGARRVDRWLLPVLPLFMLYAVYVVVQLRNFLPRYLFLAVLFLMFIPSWYQTAVLLYGYSFEVPAKASYEWAKNNLPLLAPKLLLTKEGLDPQTKLPALTSHEYIPYESENGYLMYPPDVFFYEYVFVSSRVLASYKNPYVQDKYPYYYSRWKNMEDTLNDRTQFVLENAFLLPKPNLVDLPEILIYRNLAPNRGNL